MSNKDEREAQRVEVDHILTTRHSLKDSQRTISEADAEHLRLTTLEGAADSLGEPGAEASSAAEFAARWNSLSIEDREAWFRAIQEATTVMQRCYQSHLPLPPALSRSETILEFAVEVGVSPGEDASGAAIWHVSRDLGDVEDWVQWYKEARLVQRVVTESEWFERRDEA